MKGQLSVAGHRHDAKPSQESYEDLLDWIDILTDPIFMRGVREGIEQLKAGEGIPHEEVKARILKKK
jgi:hypothetical protein